jgi:hypothetical protein
MPGWRGPPFGDCAASHANPAQPEQAGRDQSRRDARIVALGAEGEQGQGKRQQQRQQPRASEQQAVYEARGTLGS